MIITLDGPAGSGKSTLARQLAQTLGVQCLDSGSLYRAVAWLVMERGLDAADGRGIEAALVECPPRLEGANRVYVGEVEVTDLIRTPEMSRLAGQVAALPAVRKRLVPILRMYASTRNLVAEGRDMGSVVFPDAQLKFFVTADPAERARRRHQELTERGVERELEAVKTEMAERDRRDETRSIAPLVRPEDAIPIDTTGLSVPEALEILLSHVQPMAP